MEQFREGRPLPAMLPSNVMFNLSIVSQPANNYSNAGNGAWRPQTCFWAFNNSNGCLIWVLVKWQPQLEEDHRSQLLLLMLRKSSRPISRNPQYQNWRNIL